MNTSFIIFCGDDNSSSTDEENCLECVLLKLNLCELCCDDEKSGTAYFISRSWEGTIGLGLTVLLFSVSDMQSSWNVSEVKCEY